MRTLTYFVTSAIRHFILPLSIAVIATPALAEDAMPTADGTQTARATGVDEVVSYARKKEEALQSIPIAAVAFGQTQLDDANIDDVLDIQMAVPNMSFTKTNFTSYDLKIRGIGNSAVATSADAGVAIHVNNIPGAFRIFETEFYDVESVEILRGPQGTLFGRNATGGSVNIRTKRATLGEYEGHVELQYGNYDHAKVKAMVNVPIGDKVAFRGVGFFFDRQGFINNLSTGNDIDDRHMYMFRGTLSIEFSENTELHIMGSYFRENDRRSRIGKQLCTKDEDDFPFSIGCTADSAGFDISASHSTLTGIWDTVFLASVLGPSIQDAIDAMLLPPGFPTSLYPIGFDSTQNSVNPTDLREHNTQFDPAYFTDEVLITVAFEHRFEDITVHLDFGYTDNSVNSVQDFFMTDISEPWNPFFVEFLKSLPSFADKAEAHASAPFGFLCLDTPVFGGPACTDRTIATDRSSQTVKQWSMEARVSSSFDGPLNFQVGFLYLESEVFTDYFVYFTGAEIVSRLVPPVFLGDPDVPVEPPFTTTPAYFLDPDSGWFNTDTGPYKLESWAIFGEVYYDISTKTRVTGGLRYSKDNKSEFSRQTLIRTMAPFNFQEASFSALTGRITLDHRIDHADGGSTLLYASYTRGYKPGGFNPPSTDPGIPETFRNETVNAYEIGAKNRIFDNQLQANISAFYYDYTGLQITRIVNRTSINDNTDASIWGFEAEFIAAPTAGLLLNFNLSFLKTKVKNLALVDPINPTAGDPNFLAGKDIVGTGVLAGQNALYDANTGFPIVENPECFLDPGGIGPNSTCITVPGIPVDLDGNELPNAPQWSINVGGQYTWQIGDSGQLVLRMDFYWQGRMWGRNYNAPRDRIDSWSQLNASIRYEHADGKYYVEIWGKNITNNDDITGHFFTDAAAGNFQNVFLLDPRTYGVTVGANF